jgi:lysozyme
MSNRIFSTNGLRRLIQLEGGICLQQYLDSAGYPTIGVGHLLTRQERRSGCVTIGDVSCSYIIGLTTEQCKQLLYQDCHIMVTALNDRLGDAAKQLTQFQFDALVIWTFNVGTTHMRTSTLVRQILMGNLQDVPDELRRWNKAKGVVVRGLVNRREHEVRYWLGL